MRRTGRVVLALALVCGAVGAIRADEGLRLPLDLAGPTTEDLKSYARRASVVEARGTFAADAGATRAFGLAVEKGGQVSLDARFARRPGFAEPVLERLSIGGKGLKSGALPIRRLEVAADGSIVLDVGALVPNLHVKRVEKLASGDSRLVGPLGIPLATATRTGDLVTGGLVIARTGVDLFRTWPLTLSSLVDLGPGAGNAQATSGSVTWTLSARIDEGPTRGTCEVAGHGSVSGGYLRGSGEARVSGSSVELDKLPVGPSALGVTLESGSVTASVRYRLNVPLAKVQELAPAKKTAGLANAVR